MARLRYQEEGRGDWRPPALGFESLVDAKIKKAIREGQFEHLAGKGEPQDLSVYYDAPEHLRVGYHVLKNAGFLPDEVRVKKEMEEIREQLAKAESEEEKKKLRLKLAKRHAKFNMCMEYNRQFNKH
ncbi:hypothetical protein AAU61_19810 [Desulfocarbo indianensis]|nr:hypothetical protein AAU61_19810 [Desulfocarbo indianensis]